MTALMTPPSPRLPRDLGASAILARFATFLRSLLTGGAATLVDVALLFILTSTFAFSPRAANVPALLAGALVQFFGNRHFAFRAGAGRVGRQAFLFALTEIVSLALNAIAYDAVARAIPLSPPAAALARAMTTNLVFLLWSYPVWRCVFRADTRAAQRG